MRSYQPDQVWDVSAVGGRVDNPDHIKFKVNAGNVIDAAHEADHYLSINGCGDYSVDSLAIEP